MLTRLAVALLGLAPLLQAQVVQKVNGPLAGSVSRFAWTPDGRYILYGAGRDTPSIDVLTSLRVADGREVVYEPYPFLQGSAHTTEFVFLPDREIVGARYSFIDWTTFPPVTGSPLHLLDRSTALSIGLAGADPRFLDDGRMLYRTVFQAYRGSTYERGWVGRWDSTSTPLEISPPVQPDNHVSLILPAPLAGVAVFGWRDTYLSPNNAELLAVPLGGGTPIPLTPPPAGQRRWVDALHVRSKDELVLYSADEETSGVSELWAVPVDGSLPPRRLNPPLVPGRALYPAIVSPDEARIVFASDLEADEVYEVWSTDIESGTSVRLSGPMSPGGDVGDAYHDDFWISPDSARLVYLADQRVDGVFELFSAPIDGHAPAVCLHSALPANFDALSSVHFTRDGRIVVFAVHMARGVALLAALADGSGSPRVLNWPFPWGGGVLGDSSGILDTVAIAPGGRKVFFLAEQDTDGVVELYSTPIDGSAPPLKRNAPLVAGGDVTAFALSHGAGAVLYRADQDVDEHFELYLLPDAPPPHARR